MPTIKEKKDQANHKRINEIFFAPLERPALAWLATHLPAWVTPDLLTAFGFAASVLIGLSYWLTNISRNYLWLASLGFVLNWFGDSLDGTLARHRKIERPHHGFFIDHTIDTISEVIIFLGLGLSPYVDYRLVSLALIGYLCMTNLAYINTIVQGVFRISYGKLGPTEARVIAIGANTIIYFMGNKEVHLPIFGTMTMYSAIVLGVVFLLFGIFFYTMISQGIELSTQDTQERTRKKSTGKN